MPDGHSQVVPHLIKLHAEDNVAIVANERGLPAGSISPEGLTLTERIPVGHKVALSNIPAGGEIRRYGTRIGTALENISSGAWVSEARVRMPDPPDLVKAPRPVSPPAPLPSLDGYTFEGFRNPDGSVGTRNVLAVSTSVQCVAGTLEFALQRVRNELFAGHWPRPTQTARRTPPLVNGWRAVEGDG